MSESPQPQFRRVLPDGRVLDVWPLTFGRSRLHIGPLVDSLFYDDTGDKINTCLAVRHPASTACSHSPDRCRTAA